MDKWKMTKLGFSSATVKIVFDRIDFVKRELNTM